MALTLSNGYILPQAGDFGSIWFPALEDNITRLNAHNHNGVNSPLLNATSVSAVYATILAADFTLVSSQYRASVTLPTGLLIENTNVFFRDPATQNKVYLDIAKVNTTTFYVYTDYAQDYEVVYS